jgi:hypothetical protein
VQEVVLVALMMQAILVALGLRMAVVIVQPVLDTQQEAALVSP